jgi:hypothetical protein
MIQLITIFEIISFKKKFAENKKKYKNKKLIYI